MASIRIGRKCIPLSTLKVYGPDQKGIVAASSELLNRSDCTIVQSEHYTDRLQGMFFQRILFENPSRVAACSRLSDASASSSSSSSSSSSPILSSTEKRMAEGLSSISEKFGVACELDWMQKPKRVAIMVSKYDHCLWELLLRQQGQELKRCEIPLVISNHPDCKSIAEDTFGIPFAVFPITPDSKEEQERRQLALLKEYDIDMIVLARYMQVLSENFLNAYKDRIINIHHSFLPAFGGGRAYHQAHERGVKLIGATVSDVMCPSVA